MSQVTVTCKECFNTIDLEKNPFDWCCPRCGNLLPIEGKRDREYVVLCSDCRSAYTAEEICNNNGLCPECRDSKIPLHHIKHFPEEIKGKMCPRFKDEENFDSEAFDSYECQDCHEDRCPFVDPNWWEEEQKYWEKAMFGNYDDDDREEAITDYINQDDDE